MIASSLRIVARIVAKPEKVHELRSVLTTLIGPSRQDPGCLGYELLQNSEDPTDFTFIEEWENVAALESHLATDHFKQAASQLEELVAVEPDIRKYQVVR